ncbi:MAG: hypothetical protein E7616_04205 [Ruminococcaceae bacterium]|nr:hypothetical protein [Oscillospiraceae bacterium]
MKKLSLVLSICLLILCFVGITAEARAATPLLVLEAEQGELSGLASISGQKVGNIGMNGNSYDSTVTFRGLNLPEDGTYTIQLHYYSGSDDRNFDMYTDLGKFHLECPNTGSFDTVGTILTEINLKKGGYLTLGSDWYGPDLDKIEVYRTDAFAFEDRVYQNADTVSFGTETKLILDKNNGVYSVAKGENTLLVNAHAETEIGGTLIASDDFRTHTVSQSGDTVTFTHDNHPTFKGMMTQTFTLKGEYILSKVEIASATEQKTNYIAPIATYRHSLTVENGVFLQIPFDNDAWVEPKFISIHDMGYVTKGYEVAAFYDDATSAGIIFGSVEHDIWKTGIHMHAENSEVMGLTVFGGIADAGTRDSSSHGMVSGTTISSPLTFIGCYDDWKDGMNAYAKANTDIAPAKESTSKVPFGFNSWGVLQSTVKYSDMVAVSNYIKEYLQPAWGEDGFAVYVNIDSYWDYIASNDATCNMSLDEALAAFVATCQKNGQQAGIYFTPFAVWYTDEELKNTQMEGSDYTFYEAALRKSDGSLYGRLDGGVALDATHPGTIDRIENRINYFISLGFSYLKLDFLTHGALEGVHYDESVETGLQAYNRSMAKIHALCNGKMFVNLSIAPIFPYQYADGRRVSCDAFAALDNTQHVLSYLTACFWEKELYQYPDPDHLLVWGSPESVARSRVTSGVICGTSFLIGDNLANITVDSEKHQRILQMFGNKEIVSVAKLGRAFTPLYAGPNMRCADTYYCIEGDYLYVAAFNFDGYTRTLSLDLSALSDKVSDTASELWSQIGFALENKTLNYSLRPDDAAVFRVYLGEGDDPNLLPDKPETPETPETPENPETPDDTQKDPENPGDNKPSDKDQTESSASSFIIMAVAAVVLAAIAAGVVILIAKKKK